MGHTEMLLAVAGLSKNAVNERILRLAGADWFSFTAAERAAYRFVHKQTLEPAAISDRDVQSLVRCFGSDRALDVIWWSCRCHYMTCVSDAFQLPLERANVFDGFISGADDEDKDQKSPP
jgi:hypothetical protein